MNAVIYSRVSSRDQVDGTSLESQEAACRDYAHRHHLVVVRVFVEDGESAKAADRPRLLELLEFCRNKAHAVKVVLVWKVDRLARNVEDHFSVKGTLRKTGVKVVSVTEQIDGGPNGKLMETILAGFAQFDNDIRAIRSVQGMQRRLQDGIWPWHPPSGYLPPKIGKKTEPDRPDPDRFDAFRKAWKLFATGAYSKANIVRLLRTEQVLASRGRPVSAQFVDRLFQNPYYMGILRDPWTGEQIQGRHVPMVTEVEFARVQVILAGSANSTPHHRASETFPLRGLVRCPSCQRFLTAAWSRGRRQRYAYYSCFYQGCPTRTRSYRAADVHDEFTGFLRTLSVSDRIVNQIVADIEAESCSNATQANELGDKAVTAKKELEGQLQELISMRIAKSVLDSEFVVHRDRLRRQIIACEAQIASSSQRPLTRAEARTLADAFQHLDCHWRQLGSNNLLLPSGYEFTRIRTAETALLFRVTGASQNPKSYWAAPTKWNLNTMISEIRAFLAIIQLDQTAENQAA